MRTQRESILNTIWVLLVRLALVAGIAYFTWRVRGVLVMVILSVMLTYMLLPPVDFLCKKRWFGLSKKTTRLCSTILVFIAFFTLAGASVKLVFSPFHNRNTTVADNMKKYYSSAMSTYGDAQQWYTKNVPAEVRKFLGDQDFKGVGAGIAGFASGVTKGTVEWFRYIVEIVMIPVLAFYFVMDSKWLKREFVALVPKRRVRDALSIFRETGEILQRYVVGQIILCILAGVLTYIALTLFGVKYALILSVLSGVTRAIPVIGPIVSGIPICIVGAVQSASIGAWLLVFTVVMHFAESKFIMPVLIGDRMKLHPALVLIALLIGAEFFGLLGMFLSAPVAAIIREMVYRYVVVPRRKAGKKRISRVGATHSELVRSEHV